MKTKYTEEQKTRILMELLYSKITVSELAEKYGLEKSLIVKWSKEYLNQKAKEQRQLKKLETENRKLKKQIDDQELNIQVLEYLIEKYLKIEPNTLQENREYNVRDGIQFE